MFFFQAEDGIRDLVRSRGLGDVYKRQTYNNMQEEFIELLRPLSVISRLPGLRRVPFNIKVCLLYTSDAADDLLCVDLGGRRIIKKQMMITFLLDSHLY